MKILSLNPCILLDIFLAKILFYWIFLTHIHFHLLCFKQAFPGDSSWVSQWASIAANHTRTDPEGSGAETSNFLHKETGNFSYNSFGEES